MIQQISVIAFDADDTLWVNEPYFQETEDKFCSLLEDYLPKHSASQELFKTEMANLDLYGYGIKAYILSMLETVLRVTGNLVNPEILHKVIQYGQEMMNKPIELLDGVEEVLQALSGKYRLVVATKGDLRDQERKLRNSGLEKYFHHIEIMSDKKEKDYHKLLKNLGCSPDHFLMLGNSLKSDVIPVLAIGGHAIHIPYHITWEHERIDYNVEDPRFYKVDSIREILQHLNP
ncbi:putative hydrolase of the HAD superfamily [Chitinophaga terrae (ex Kim and Jung 2007)]|uniref:HAD family hydrolase n=1 Tax=Chitinophaga terrae (ex Kim and Jung 2007) TaxID=408074 RepID=UPI002787E5D2|nr:HAD family hydrolase [Chitinophaga terrae (ex Kim and Jung 2007)]MDQ0109613.1 putative hydrolase of the HAD superfamily [Chitinophaga terrae (ex Kim and Jung 2007)]